MRATIEKLRNRPKEDRQMIATASSGAVVAVLLLGWGISTMGMFSNMSESQTAAVANTNTKVIEQVGGVMQSASAASASDMTRAQMQGTPTAETPSRVTDTGAVVTIPASQ